MRIYQPTPKLSPTDRRLLILISELILEQLDEDVRGANFPKDRVALSDAEAAELLHLLETLVQSEGFKRKANFVEAVAAIRNINNLEKEYTRGRHENGKAIPIGSRNWWGYSARLGRDPNAGWPVNVERMTFFQFMKMEEKLFLALGLNPRVSNLLLTLIERNQNQIEALRAGRTRIRLSIISDYLMPIIETISGQRNGLITHNEVPINRLAAAFTLISNLSVLFTTRDWDVTGTISGMGGALIVMINTQSK